MGDNQIFVSCDTSDYCTGAVHGSSPETVQPVTFKSQQLKGAELNYPVHKKELLTIVHALQKWCVNLIGVPFTIFTDHRTPKNFDNQKHLSCRQARWQEELSQYDFNIVYIAGSEDMPANSMSPQREHKFIDPTAIGAL